MLAAVQRIRDAMAPKFANLSHLPLPRVNIFPFLQAQGDSHRLT
jgi:hypothetical protein